MANFPISAEAGNKVGDGWRVETSVRLSSNGRLDGQVELINKHALEGFSGGAVILLTDAAGNVVHNAGLFRIGVNAAGFLPKRTAVHVIDALAPADKMAAVEGLEIINGHFPKDVAKLIQDNVNVGISIAEAISRINLLK